MIESKWDNLSDIGSRKIVLRKEQKLRHKVFSWYLTHWSKKYAGKWNKFVEDNRDDFKEEFKGKKKGIPKVNSKLAENLQYVLKALQSYCRLSSERNVKNIVVFFSKEKTKTVPVKRDSSFHIINVSYGDDVVGNFIKVS